MNKIYLAIPAFRGIEPDTRAAIERDIQGRKNWELGCFKELLHQSMISRARNIFAKLFMGSDCTHLLFIDADIVLLSPNAIDALVDTDVPIVAGVYVFKDYPHSLAIRFLKPENILDLPPLFNVRYASTGFMLIKKEVFLKLKTPFPFLPMVVNNEYLSEDWSFCERARDKSFTIWVRQDIELGHLGLYPFTIKDYLKMKERGVLK